MVKAAYERTRGFYLGLMTWTISVIWLVTIDLGVVAFTCSVLLSIWVFGFRDRFESEASDSAYSVFNQNGKAIIGGFTGQQFDRQMRGGTDLVNDENSGNETATGGAPFVTTRKDPREKINDDARLKRRRAAAEAAERRSGQP